MIEYEYPECTTSVITSFAIFRKHYPNYRAEDIEYVIQPHCRICRFNLTHFINRKTIRRSITYLHAAQQPEGGWVGSWGICFTYATMFALESLSLVGETYETSKSARRACDFLVSKQSADGGWGESYKVCHIPPSSLRTRLRFCEQGCEACVWVEHEDTQVVQTAWAAMALMYAKYPHTEPIAKAVTLVMSRQLPVCDFDPTSCLPCNSLFSGWLMGTRSHRRDLQQDLCDIISELQVLIHNMDAWQGT